MKKKIKMKPKIVTLRKRPPEKDGRRSDGKFLPGHAVKSPGNPHAIKIATYTAALKHAVSEEELREVFVTLKRLALRGEIDAIRELLNRTLGKARVADNLASIDLPDLATTKDTVKASNAIIAAVRNGKLGTDDAAKLASLVELARRSIETDQLAERLAQLEQEIGR
jgi:hypothetical protein